ncbi:MAG: AsmA-like C-terminal region-containing protein [Desulfobacteraceae bacterium]|nr:AsmA-like C-terminal region-containing protein [Desulfobacteraceae bacterium]
MRRATKYLIAATLIFCVVIIVHAGFLIFSPLLAERMESALGKKLEAKVEIKGLKYSFFTGARIDSIIIDPGDSEDKKQKAIHMSGMEIGIPLFSFISGNYLPERIKIRDMELSLDEPALDWLISLSSDSDRSGKIPALEVMHGNIGLRSPFSEKPLQINNLKVSGPQGGPIAMTGRACFDKCQDGIEFIMNWSGSVMEAEIQAKDFELSSLPVFRTQDQVFDPGLLNITERLTGKISIRFSPETKTLTAENGIFDTAGGSLVISSAGISFDKTGIQRAWMQADARRIKSSIIENFYKKFRINEGGEAQIHEGRLNIGAFVHWGKDRGLDYEADVSVRDGSVYFPEIKTGVENIEADLEIFSPGRIIIHSSTGWVSNGKVGVAGLLNFKDAAIKDHRLEFTLNEVAAQKEMYLLLPSDVREVVKNMKVEKAEINGRIVLASKETRINLDVKAQQTSMPGLPFTVNSPAARIKWNSGVEQVTFSECRGYVNGGLLEGNLVLKFREPLNADFTLYGRQLPVNTELLTWLGMDETPWKISGSYDVELSARNWRPGTKSPAEAIKKLRVQADLRNLSFKHRGHGPVANNWYGHLAIDDKGTRITDFSGDILGVGFHGSGTIPAKDSSDAYFRLESENIALSEELYGRLPFGDYMKKSRLTGQCKLSAELRSLGADLMPNQGSVSAVIHNLDTGGSNLKAGLGGTARLRFSGLDTRNVDVKGAFDLNRIKFNRFEANLLSGRFTFNNGRIEIPEMEINAYGGNIRFTDSFISVRDFAWQTKFSPARLDLESIMGAFGITGRSAPAGSLRGQIELKGKKLDSEALEGSGEIKISHGMLYKFPIIASVFNVLDLQFPRQSPITDAYGTFDVKNGMLRIKDLLLTGGTVPMHLEGSLGLKNNVAFKKQKIDLLVTAAKTNGLLNRIPIVGWIKHYTLDMFRRLAMQARIEGSVENYKVDRLASPVTKPIERMWSLMEKLAPSPPQR